jgi:hypothetical protein
MALFSKSPPAWGQVGVNRAEGGQVGEIDCAAYTSTPPRNAADFLELAENGVFWIGN